VTTHSSDIESEQLLRLSEEVSRIAGTLAQLSLGTAVPPPSVAPSTKSSTIESKKVVSRGAVRWLINARRERARYLSDELFADPAWDILLDLLHAELVSQRTTVSSLCIAAGVPATTGLRWISNMVKSGLLLRQPDKFDGRRVYVELAPDVSDALRNYIADVVQPPLRNVG
jgi:DNA-binding MarR family transcriptional regulator